MKWVTREKAKVESSLSWLIKRFIDSEAKFLLCRKKKCWK